MKYSLLRRQDPLDDAILKALHCRKVLHPVQTVAEDVDAFEVREFVSVSGFDPLLHSAWAHEALLVSFLHDATRPEQRLL